MQPSDLSQLVALDALLQESHVTRAADRLGLSTPAVSHALARLRERFGDPLLVRAGRSMVLTPVAEALRPVVRDAVAHAERVFATPAAFDPQVADDELVIAVSDYVLLVLGRALDRAVLRGAPRLRLRFVPNRLEDPQGLREGEIDIAIGIYGELPAELKTRVLLTESFVCLVREGHPEAERGLSLAAYARLSHVQAAPRGQPGGYIDELLEERGLSRHVARAVPYFSSAVDLVAQSDYVLTVPSRVAAAVAGDRRLRILKPPLPLEPYALSMVWHPRLDEHGAHRWLRDRLVACAEETAAPRVEGARRRLGKKDPTAGPRRRR